MAIPYYVTCTLPGRFKLKSEFFKYLPVSEQAIDRFVKQQEGVTKVKLNQHTGSITIDYHPQQFNPGVLLNILDEATPDLITMALTQFETAASDEETETEKGVPPEEENEFWTAKGWLTLNTIGFLPFLWRAAIPAGFFTAMTLTLAVPVLKKAYNAIRGKKLDVHLLDSSAIVLSTLLRSPFSSMLMVWLLSLGDYIEGKTRGSASKEIEKLLNYADETAWLVLPDETIVKAAVPDLKVGDRVVTYTGQKITVDGTVTDGEALVNQTSLTGESNPVHKKVGDKVYAGTYVEDGKVYVMTEKVGHDTVLAKIVHIIQESAGKPIQIQKRAEELANQYVMPTFAVSGGIYAMTQNLSRTVSTLTFDYHTGVHVSTPTSIMSHMALAAKRGILFKSGRHIEILHHVDTIVFDKTGTLTRGHPEITQVIAYEISEKDALRYAASLEERVSHPVAKSIVQHAEDQKLTIPKRKNSKYHMGLGVEAEINKAHFLFGSSKFMEKKEIAVPKKIKQAVDQLHEKGESVLYLVRDEVIVALVAFTDPIRPESKDMINVLHGLGREVILCTGDNENAAAVVAEKLNIKQFHARAFPEDKAKVIKALKAKNKKVAFMGDGVNDSPALAVADIGISINSGADIAIEVADVVIGNDLRHLIEAIKIADLTLANMAQNYKINKYANTVGMMGAIAGVFSPVVATMINNGTTVFMGINAVRPLWQQNNSSNFGVI